MPSIGHIEWNVVGWFVVIFLAFMFFALGFIARRWRKVGPNQVLVVFGRRGTYTDPITGQKAQRGFRIARSGGVFVWPVLEDFAVLSLEILTIDITPPPVFSVQGVPVIVEGVAQIKVKGDEQAIATAAEQFLGKSQAEIATVAHQTLEGHLRAIIGTMNVVDIVTNRDTFAQRVQDVSATDLANMGLMIVSFVIKDVRDTQGYLEAWGRPNIAQIKRDATIGEAEANRDATIRSAQANQEGQTAKYIADTKIAEADRDYKMKVADYTGSVKQKQADADLSYDLQKFKTQQLVKAEEVQIQVIEKQKQAEVQEQEILRREKELSATVEKPVLAEKNRIERLAEAEQFRLQATATGQAEAIRATGTAEADAQRAKGLAGAEVIKAQGFAEADAMAKKADAWQGYNEAAIVQMFLEGLPLVARAVSEPLSKTEKIIIIGSGEGGGAGASRITKDVTNVIAQLPPVIEALTGMRLEDLIKRVPQLGELVRKPQPPVEEPPIPSEPEPESKEEEAESA